MKKIFLIILTFLITPSVSVANTALDLLWEAESYTPPFYQGVALPSKGSLIKVVALPNLFYGGKELTPNKITYRWEKDGNFMASASGVDKQTFSFNARAENTIRLTVSTPNNLTKITKTLNLKAVEPKINFYPVNEAGETIFNQTIKGPLSLTFKELRLLAVPYYLAGNNFSEPRFSWFYNNQSISADPLEPNIIKLVPPENTTGENQTVIKLKAESSLVRQTAEKNLIIKF